MASDDRSLDRIDLTILRILQKNARTSQVDIARAVKLAPSAVLERIRKLERGRVIAGYAALVDPHAIAHSMLAFVAVRTDDRPGEERVGRALARIPEVLEVHHVAGEDCLMLKVRARDAEHLGELLRKRFGRIPGLRSTRTTIVLDSLKEDPRLPVPAGLGSNGAKRDAEAP